MSQTSKSSYHKEWTPEELEILKQSWADHSIGELVELIPHHSELGIKGKAFKLGLRKDFLAKRRRQGQLCHAFPADPFKNQPKLPDPRERTVIAFEPEGIREFPSVAAAAEFYGICKKTVYNLIESAGTTNNGIGFNYMI